MKNFFKLTLGMALACAIMTGCSGAAVEEELGLSDGECFIILNDGQKYEFVNADGEPIFDKKFDGAHYFHDGLAWVQDSTSIYFINKKGEKAFDATFASATDFIDGVAVVAQPDSCMKVIDTSGKTLLRIPEYTSAYPFGKGRYVVADKNGRRGVIDKSGKVLITPIFDRISGGSDGKYIVELKGEYGVVDESDSYVYDLTQCESLSLIPGSDNLIIKKDGKSGIVNTKGEYVVNPVYLVVEQRAPGVIAFLSDDGKWGLMDKNGQILIKPKYEKLGDNINFIPMAHGHVKATLETKYLTASTNGKKCGVIDLEGNIIVRQKYDGIYTFKDQFFVIKDNKVGMADIKGEEVIEPQFDFICPFLNKDKTFAYLNGNFVIIDKTGKILKELTYQEVNLFAASGMANSQFFDEQAVVNAMIERFDEIVKTCAADIEGAQLVQVAKHFNVDMSDLKRQAKQWNIFGEMTRYRPCSNTEIVFSIELPTNSNILCELCPVSHAMLSCNFEGDNATEHINKVATALKEHYKLEQSEKGTFVAEFREPKDAKAALVYNISLTVSENIKVLSLSYSPTSTDYGEEY